MRHTQISLNTQSWSQQGDSAKLTAQSLVDHPILKRPYPTARNRLIMPHLVNKVKLDNALDKYISEVVELNSHGHRYR